MVLSKIPDRTFDNPRGRVAVIMADFHEEISNGLLKGVEDVFENYEDVKWQIHHVPGAFELPLMVQKLARTMMEGSETEHMFDVIVVLGCIVKGETYHFEMVANECARGCMDIMLREDIPVVFEVLAPHSLEDGLKRSSGDSNHGRLAAYAALDWLVKFHK